MFEFQQIMKEDGISGEKKKSNEQELVQLYQTPIFKKSKSALTNYTF